jgi:hypothetical protein
MYTMCYMTYPERFKENAMFSESGQSLVIEISCGLKFRERVRLVNEKGEVLEDHTTDRNVTDLLPIARKIVDSMSGGKSVIFTYSRGEDLLEDALETLRIGSGKDINNLYPSQLEDMYETRVVGSGKGALFRMIGGDGYHRPIFRFEFGAHAGNYPYSNSFSEPDKDGRIPQEAMLMGEEMAAVFIASYMQHLATQG